MRQSLIEISTQVRSFVVGTNTALVIDETTKEGSKWTLATI
ncbi:hypothetical protein [Bacillus sp. Hm123]